MKNDELRTTGIDLEMSGKAKKNPKTGQETSRLRRQRIPMPDFIREALTERGLAAAYDARPPYQRNDYIGWITHAGLPDTRQKRLDQMLDELDAGDSYMKMPYRARKPREAWRKAKNGDIGSTNTNI
jgi:uncharacterized protein YdeI (YjbR/CyaY-like superfamily)